MHAFLQRQTLRHAGLATLFTGAACLPRLLAWNHPRHTLGVLVAGLLGCAFCLWGFVFAWHEQESGRKVILLRPRRPLWIGSTATGAAAALLAHFGLDPLARTVDPANFPANTTEWAAMTLFTLGFEQLFLCFAPFAFWARLFHRVDLAFWLTLASGIGVLALKFAAAGMTDSTLMLIVVGTGRLILSAITLYFYLQGGLLVATWWLLLLQSRHLLVL